MSRPREQPRRCRQDTVEYRREYVNGIDDADASHPVDFRAISELDVAAQHSHGIGVGCNPVSVAAVDTRLRGPETGDRVPVVDRVLKVEPHHLTHQSRPTMRGKHRDNCRSLHWDMAARNRELERVPAERTDDLVSLERGQCAFGRQRCPVEFSKVSIRDVIGESLHDRSNEGGVLLIGHWSVFDFRHGRTITGAIRLPDRG